MVDVYLTRICAPFAQPRRGGGGVEWSGDACIAPCRYIASRWLHNLLVLQQTVQAEDGTARSRRRECLWITGYVEEFFEEWDTVRHLAWKFAQDRRTLLDRELYQNHLLLLVPACKHATANFPRVLDPL